MNIDNWINLIAAILIGGGTLFLGIMAWRNIRQTRNIQKTEKRERLLNEIIEWATDVVNCSSRLGLPLVKGIDRTTMLVYGRSNLYFQYRSVNARRLYIEKIANTFGEELESAIKPVTSKLIDFIKILEANIESLQKNGTEDEKAAIDCELKLYDLTRDLIEKVAEVKVKEEGIEAKEGKKMPEIDVGQELVQIKKLLLKMDRRGQFQWEYNIGFAGIIASVGIVNLDPWAALIVFALGFGLMGYAIIRKRA